MKLATLNDGSRDGSLVVVSRDLSRCIPATDWFQTVPSVLTNIIKGSKATIRCSSDKKRFPEILKNKVTPSFL